LPASRLLPFTAYSFDGSFASAFQKAQAKSGKTEKIDDFTPERRLFINWAQV
jgi:predicted metalloendopeptidase